uniref:Transporter n=1 Tax=Steinernema glaseri TaxID=37863 RepID=A0A1I7XZD3_9BILA
MSSNANGSTAADGGPEIKKVANEIANKLSSFVLTLNGEEPSEMEDASNKEDPLNFASDMTLCKEKPKITVHRQQWGSQLDFLMSLIGYAVGLGNVWRFPYLCFKNGGGSFLFAYVCFWVLGTVPIFFMEVSVGQFLRRGGIEVWRKACPIFKGVGYGNVLLALMCCSYYCVIITWALFYFFASFSWEFPWESCTNYWNDKYCITGKEPHEVIAKIAANLTGSTETSVEQFWEKRVLLQSNTIDDFGGIQLELFALMVVAWLIVYFALWKGITEAKHFMYFCAICPYFILLVLLLRGVTLPGAWQGVSYFLTPKMAKLYDSSLWKDAGTQAKHFMYFCAICPYFILLVLLLRGVTLPGAWQGVSYFLTPKMAKLYDSSLWKDAGTQVFYSYGVGFGTLMALGSHNKYKHNAHKTVITVSLVNTGTSMLAGFVVFSILGHMATTAEKNVGEIVKPGVGLAFLAYPEVATILPLKQVWAVLFFLMLVILGIDTQVCLLEGAVVSLEDVLPPKFRKYRKATLAVFCVILFAAGIPMLSRSGIYWLTLVDQYGASGYALLFVVFFEVVGLAWGFESRRLSWT